MMMQFKIASLMRMQLKITNVLELPKKCHNHEAQLSRGIQRRRNEDQIRKKKKKKKKNRHILNHIRTNKEEMQQRDRLGTVSRNITVRVC